MGYGIDLDNRSVTFITGYTYSREFPTSPDAYQRTHDAEFRDAFIMSFDFKSPIADAGPDLTIDQHEAVQFDGTGSMDNLGIDNWTWSFNDGRGACALYGSGPSHTFHEAGTFTVSLNVTDSSGNWAVDRMNVTVRDSTRPFADAGPDISIDQFETAVFDGSSSGDNVGIVNATWRFEYGGKQIQLEGINASFKFDVAGMFLVELIVSDAAGNQASDVLEVWVRDVTSPTANAGPDLSIDQHQTVTFNGTASSDNVAILDWVWTFKYNWT
jgi:PKD repeat protein